MDQTIRERIVEFLDHSNRIEGVYGQDALDDAIFAFENLLLVPKLSKEAILKCHKDLLWALDPRIAGKIRTVNVMVGGRQCPDHANVEGLLKNWLHWVNGLKLEGYSRMKEIAIQQMHVEFEKIHPFQDGNGRVGRMIMNWQRVNAGMQVHIIHEGVEQKEYYKWFN